MGRKLQDKITTDASESPRRKPMTNIFMVGQIDKLLT
jgi:hypothetical protein